MAPSTMENQQEQSMGHGYTHKKFNCSYSHKKLGMRLRQREDGNKENLDKQLVTKKQTLFRPYALGNDTPRKRKFSRSSADSSDDENSQNQFLIAEPSVNLTSHTTSHFNQFEDPSPVATNNPSAPQTCSSPALSPNSYAERLQRQRAALYMRYMQQFHSGNRTTAVSQDPVANASAFYQHMGYPNVTAPIYNGC